MTRVNFWPPRARKAFKHYGLGENPKPETVARKLTAVDLLKRPNCGRVTINKIASRLRESGLELRVGCFFDDDRVWDEKKGK